MCIRVWLGLIVMWCVSTACAVTPIPPPTQAALPAASPIPTVTAALAPTSIRIVAPTVIIPISIATPLVLSTPVLFPGLLAKPPGEHYPPVDVPGCIGMQILDEPVKFNWDKTVYISGIMAVPEPQWTFYQCEQSHSELAIFYQQWMKKPPYSNWVHYDWDERPEGTLAVYNNGPVSTIHTYRWLYIWFLPDKTSSRVSNLVAAWWDPPHNC